VSASVSSGLGFSVGHASVGLAEQMQVRLKWHFSHQSRIFVVVLG
jgi:hypothetical protein